MMFYYLCRQPTEKQRLLIILPSMAIVQLSRYVVVLQHTVCIVYHIVMLLNLADGH